MKLVIHAHALRKEALSPAIDGQFDELGGTIGRAVTNTMALPDPQRHVSRRHAEVQFSGNTFSIRNVGSGNPIELNGKALKPGEAAPLAVGDKLVIGGYAMRVAVVAEDSARPPSPRSSPRATVSRAAGREAVGELAADLPMSGPAITARPRATAGARPPLAVQHLPTLASVHEPGVAGLMPPTTKVSTARAEGPRPGANRPAPAPAPASIAAAAPSESPMPNSAENIVSPAALWAAFCEGAGVSLPMPQGLDPPMMRLMGQLMRHALEGTLKLVSARTADRPELRVQGAAMAGKNNNPLKFAVDTQAALAQLLQPPMRGFMPGPEAVRDAMDDLLCHHAGTVAGSRAARQGILDRFEPGRLEARLANQGSIDAVLPMNRRSKLWELYIERHPQLQDEAQEDFQQLFASAFVKAYEDQLERIRRARSAK